MVSESVREQILDYVAQVETGRSSFMTSFLKYLARGMEYTWYCRPPHERFVGMLSVSIIPR